jgi:hypothetical protein
MSTETAATLIRALIENMRRAGDDWESVAMVLEFDSGELRGTYGYVYSPDGAPTAVSARPSQIEAAAAAYAADHYKPGQRLPVKMLVQFDRTKSEYEVTFEDTDVSRWQVTPENIHNIREELRPTFY